MSTVRPICLVYRMKNETVLVNETANMIWHDGHIIIQGNVSPGPGYAITDASLGTNKTNFICLMHGA